MNSCELDTFHVCIQLFVVLFLDIDECLGNPCDRNAICSNTAGSFSCTCKNGYSGNGTACNGMKLHCYVVLCFMNAFVV